MAASRKNCPIPEVKKQRAEQLHKELVEAVAVNDETLMEHYLDKGELDEDEMRDRAEKITDQP